VLTTLCYKLYRFQKYLKQCIASVLVRIYLRMCGVKFGKNLCIYSFPICYRNSRATIKLGSNVTIYNKLSENMAGISHRTVLCAQSPDSCIHIGNNVGISGAILFCVEEITIEDNVLLGVNVKIYDSDFHPIHTVSRRNKDVSAIKKGRILICKDAWLGAESMVLKGVTIGSGAVVAARSVVTRDVAPGTIVAGVPAREIGKVKTD